MKGISGGNLDSLYKERPRKRFVLSTPFALGAALLQAILPLLQSCCGSRCLAPSLPLDFVMQTRSWDSGAGLTNKRKTNAEAVLHKRLIIWKSDPNRIKLLYICSEMSPMVCSKLLPHRTNWGTVTKSCCEDAARGKRNKPLSYQQVPAQPSLL